jgi:hypothetical protein
MLLRLLPPLLPVLLSAAATTTTNLSTSSDDLKPADILRNAAAVARASAIILRKALPAISPCSDEEHTLATILGMEAPPASYWTLKPANHSCISALSRDGNTPPACRSSLPTICEDDEPILPPESIETPDDSSSDGLSLCFSTCSSLRPEDRGSDDAPLVDPLFSMLWAKVQKEVSEESDDDDDDEDDDYDGDDDEENLSCTSLLNQLETAQKCSAFVSSCGALLGNQKEPTSPVVPSVRPSLSIENERSEPAGIERALDSLSYFLPPAPLSLRKKVVELVAHPEPKRVLVSYDKRTTHCKLHPTLEALCLHLNA